MEKIAVLLLNMGGPKLSEHSNYFLKNLFTDSKIIKLPFQKIFGPLIAHYRTNKLKIKYDQIGGGSPIHKWTADQSLLLENRLNNSKILKNNIFKCFYGFQYVQPHIHETLEEIYRQKFDRIVIFPQYMQYSCTTTGSCLNFIMNHFESSSGEKKMIKTHLIDRWFSNDYLIQAFVDSIKEKISELSNQLNKDIFIVFSAHSLPQYIVERGDTYPWEVASTVNLVMKKLNFSYPYRLAWQSKVGFLRWLTPSTFETVKNLCKNPSINSIIIVPIAFTSDHIETLHELDIELMDSIKKLNTKKEIRRVCSLNDNPSFIDCLESEVTSLVKIKRSNLIQFNKICPGCVDEGCLKLRRFVDYHFC